MGTSDFYERVLLKCYELIKDKYDERGIPIFYHVTNMSEHIIDRDIVCLYFILKYSNCSLPELEKELSIETEYQKNLLIKASMLVQKDEGVEEFCKRIYDDEQVRRIKRNEFKSYHFYGRYLSKQHIEHPSIYREYEIGDNRLSDLLFSYRIYKGGMSNFMSIDIYDRKLDSVVFYENNKEEEIYSVKKTAELSSTCIEEIKSVFDKKINSIKYEDLKFSKQNTNDKSPHYHVIGFYLKDKVFGHYSIINDFDHSDKKTNYIETKKNEVLSILINVGFKELEKYVDLVQTELSI